MNKPSRRAVVRTGVWAVPAVAVVSMAPAFAGSGQPPVQIDSTGAVCKDPGQGQNTKDYEFTLFFTNNSASDQVVTITNINFKDQNNPNLGSFTVPANAVKFPKTFKLTHFTDSSSNPVATVTYSVSGVVGTQTVTFPTPIHPC